MGCSPKHHWTSLVSSAHQLDIAWWFPQTSYMRPNWGLQVLLARWGSGEVDRKCRGDAFGMALWHWKTCDDIIFSQTFGSVPWDPIFQVGWNLQNPTKITGRRSPDSLSGPWNGLRKWFLAAVRNRRTLSKLPDQSQIWRMQLPLRWYTLTPGSSSFTAIQTLQNEVAGKQDHPHVESGTWKSIGFSEKPNSYLTKSMGN